MCVPLCIDESRRNSSDRAVIMRKVVTSGNRCDALLFFCFSYCGYMRVPENRLQSRASYAFHASAFLLPSAKPRSLLGSRRLITLGHESVDRLDFFPLGHGQILRQLQSRRDQAPLNVRLFC